MAPSHVADRRVFAIMKLTEINEDVHTDATPLRTRCKQLFTDWRRSNWTDSSL